MNTLSSFLNHDCLKYYIDYCCPIHVIFVNKENIELNYHSHLKYINVYIYIRLTTAMLPVYKINAIIFSWKWKQYRNERQHRRFSLFYTLSFYGTPISNCAHDLSNTYFRINQHQKLFWHLSKIFILALNQEKEAFPRLTDEGPPFK